MPFKGNTATFTIPTDFSLGSYTGIVSVNGRTFGVCEPVDVRPFANWAPRLDEFQPAATYDWDEVYISGSKEPVKTARLTLRGGNFLVDNTEDNHIVINGDELSVDWSGCSKAPDLSDEVKAKVARSVQAFGTVVSPERIELCRVSIPAGLTFNVSVRQGSLETEKHAFSVYRYTKFVVAVTAAIFGLMLAALVVTLVYVLIKHQPAERRFKALKVLFLDPETNTYSLSKFQFYLWTAAALFGYGYLVIGRMLVQGSTWPEVPDGLPGIIAIGTGTAVGSQVVSTLNGPKGSGNEDPSPGDLVTSGGVAAADRIQMFVWTIFGVVTFCIAALREGPGTISKLDPVPTSMLYMMGISSVGYLGGKLARKPGPILNEMSVTPSDPDDVIAGASAVPSAPPNLSQPVAQAQAAAVSFASNVPAGSAANAVKALQDAIDTARKATTTLDAQNAAAALVDFRNRAEAAAVASAGEFSATGTPDSSRAAEIAQQAASILQDLAAGVGAAVSMAVAPPTPGSTGLRFTRVIELRGRNMSSQGLFEINGEELSFRMLRADGDSQRLPEVVIREPDNPEMGRLIRLSIDPLSLETSDLKQYKKWFGTSTSASAKLTFAVINPDGQKAELSFSVPPSEAQSAGKQGQASPPPPGTPAGGNK